MKLSRREKILLCILAVLGLSYLYYTYMLTPLLQKASEAKITLEQQKQNESFAKIQMSTNNKIYMDYKVLNAKLEMTTQRFFPFIIQEKLLIYLEDMIKTTEVAVSSITFSEPSLSTPNEENKEEKSEIDPEIQRILNEISGKESNEQSKTEEKNQTEDNYGLEYMTITMVIEGKYEEIVNLMRKIEYFNKKILIGSLNLISNDNDLVSGTITLDIYAIPKLQIKSDEYFTWKSLFEYGKENPFEPFLGYTPYINNTENGLTSEEDNTESNSISEKKVYDFTAIIKPVSSDLPAFIIGNAKLKNNSSYLYADNPNYEDVEFNVFKKDSKYYYRYKTSSSNYPKDYENEFVQFTPYSNSIEFNISSQQRNDNTDVNGINITIINNTDLTLNVDIINDDATRPRVNISKMLGNIKINR